MLGGPSRYTKGMKSGGSKPSWQRWDALDGGPQQRMEGAAACSAAQAVVAQIGSV